MYMIIDATFSSTVRCCNPFDFESLFHPSFPAACSWVYPLMKIIEEDPVKIAAAKKDLEKSLSVLDDYLLFRTFLVGESVTLADIFVACDLLLPFKLVLSASVRKNFVNVTRWFVTVVNQKYAAEVLGKVELC